MAGEFEQIGRLAAGEKIYCEGVCEDGEPHVYRPLSISKAARDGYEVTASCKKCGHKKEFFCVNHSELQSKFHCELSSHPQKEIVSSPPRRTG